MDLFITGDSNPESGVSQVLYETSGATRRHFTPIQYGEGLAGVAVALMCRDPELKFKRRIRLDRKEKILYMDIMLDLEQMQPAKHEVRKKIILHRLAEEIPAVLHKYAIRDFDEARFVDDLKGWLAGL